MSLNPLIYATIKNNIPSKNLKDYNLTRALSNNASNDANTYLNNVLSNTSIKRACCLNTDASKQTLTIPVRIPMPHNVNTEDDINQTDELAYGYYDTQVSFPTSICDSLNDGNGNNVQYKSGSGYCKAFSDVYCNNMKYLLMDELKTNGNKPYVSGMLSDYKNECSCYEPPPAYDIPMAANLQPGCYAPNCSADSGAFYEPSYACDVSVTVCQAFANISTGSISGGASIVPSSITQNCSSKNVDIEQTANSAPNSGGGGGGAGDGDEYRRDGTGGGGGGGGKNSQLPIPNTSGNPQKTLDNKTPDDKTPDDKTTDKKKIDDKTTDGNASSTLFSMTNIIGCFGSMSCLACCVFIFLGLIFFMMSARNTKGNYNSMGDSFE